MSEKAVTVGEVVEQIGFGRFHVFLVCICGILHAADAMEMLILAFLSRTLQCEWRLISSEVALLTTCVFLGMMVGAPLLGMLSDKYGRWNALFLCSLNLSYYAILSAAAVNLIWFLVLRSFVGFFIGGLLASGATLVSELMPIAYRAKLLITVMGFWAVGGLFQIGLARLTLGTAHINNSWRWLVFVSCIPVFLCMFLFLFIPKSPRFLLGIGDTKGAIEVLNNIAKWNKQPEFAGKLKEEKLQRRGSVLELFSTRTYARLTVCLNVIWFACGFLYYGLVLLTISIPVTRHKCLQNWNSHFQASNSTGEDCCKPISTNDYITLSISTFGEFFGQLICFLFIDSFGRRKLLMVLFIILPIFLLSLQFCMNHLVMDILLFLGRGIALASYVSTYVYTNEAYPTSVRTSGMGLNSGMSRIGALITPFVAQVLLPDVSMLAALILYSVVSLLAALAVFCLPFDTEGCELKQSFNEPVVNSTAFESTPLKSINSDYKTVLKEE